MTGIPTAPIALPLLRPRARFRFRLRRPHRAPAAVGAVLALLIAGAAVLVSLSGLSSFIIESPSMGRAAPVGTLVLAERPDVARLRPGDVVTYRSFDGPGTVTHRVVAVVPGGFRTKGDVNGAADARVVPPERIVGRAAALLPGVGWLIRLAPWMTVGALSVWALSLPVTSDAARAGLRIVGLCVVTTSALLVMRPLLAWTVLSRVPTGHGLMMTVVPTGLLPIRLAADHGTSIDAQPGQVVRLLLPADNAGRVLMTAGPAMDAVGWIGLVLLCLLPLIGVLTLGLPPEEEARG